MRQLIGILTIFWLFVIFMSSCTSPVAPVLCDEPLVVSVDNGVITITTDLNTPYKLEILLTKYIDGQIRLVIVSRIISGDKPDSWEITARKEGSYRLNADLSCQGNIYSRSISFII